MKSNDVFPSKHLKAADIGTASPVVQIERVELEALDKAGKEQKPVIYFVGKVKGLVCNKTNWRQIVKITGQEDSDNWTGWNIQLYTAEVDFQGDVVPALRVRAPRNTKPANGNPASRPKPTPPPPPVEEADEYGAESDRQFDEDGTEIPF